MRGTTTGLSSTRTIQKSVAYSTCPSGKANYQQTLLNGKVVNEIFIGCVIKSKRWHIKAADYQL
jgi:hypothetical protein